MKVNSLDGLMLLGLLSSRIGNIHVNGEGETRYDLTLTLSSKKKWWWWEPR